MALSATRVMSSRTQRRIQTVWTSHTFRSDLLRWKPLDRSGRSPTSSNPKLTRPPQSSWRVASLRRRGQRRRCSLGLKSSAASARGVVHFGAARPPSSAQRPKDLALERLSDYRCGQGGSRRQLFSNLPRIGPALNRPLATHSGI